MRTKWIWEISATDVRNTFSHWIDQSERHLWHRWKQILSFRFCQSGKPSSESQQNYHPQPGQMTRDCSRETAGTVSQTSKPHVAPQPWHFTDSAWASREMLLGWLTVVASPAGYHAPSSRSVSQNIPDLRPLVSFTYTPLVMIWMFMSIQNSRAEILPPMGLWLVIRSWEWRPHDWDCCLCKRDLRDPALPSHHVRRPRKHLSVRKWPSPETQSSSALISDFVGKKTMPQMASLRPSPRTGA